MGIKYNSQVNKKKKERKEVIKKNNGLINSAA